MESTARVGEYLTSLGIPVEVRELDSSARNSVLAAGALGCSVGEIAKSVVFVAESLTCVVVIAGDKKVAAAKLSAVVGKDVRIATPSQVRELTGYAVGGVPPFPHLEGVLVLADKSLERFRHVWAAAGSPHSVFRMASADLAETIGIPLVDVSA